MENWEINREIKLERLRKLYAFARGHKNTRWMQRIKADAERIKAERIKNEKEAEDPQREAFEVAKEIFGVKSDNSQLDISQLDKGK